MFRFIRNKPILFSNGYFKDYCMRSSQDSIKKLIENKDRDKNNPKIKISLDDNNDNNDKNDKNTQMNFSGVIFFISISSLLFLYYRRIK